MGVNGFNAWLKKKGLVHVAQAANLLRGKRVAVDGTWLLYNVMMGAAKSDDPRQLSTHLAQLIDGWFDVGGAAHVFFIVDGPPVAAKRRVIHPKRREAAQKFKQRSAELLAVAKREVHTASMALPTEEEEEAGDISMLFTPESMEAMRLEAERVRAEERVLVSNLRLTPSTVVETLKRANRKLRSGLPVEFISAPHDAEAYVGLMCQTRVADVAIASDGDTHMFGADTKINDVCSFRAGHENVKFSRLSEIEAVVRGMQSDTSITPHQALIHATVLSGSDYAFSLKGMGWVKALAWVCKHGGKCFQAFDIPAQLMPRPHKGGVKPPLYKLPDSLAELVDMEDAVSVQEGLDSLLEDWEWAVLYFMHRAPTSSRPAHVC